MQKIKKFIRANYKLVSVALVASLTGGLVSTVLVTQAAIPASDGTIHSCRNNTTTMLRVIDNASQACDSNESALNWDQKGVKAYGRVTYTNIGGTYSLDFNRSYNIANFQSSNVNIPIFGFRQFCITIAGTPENISANIENDQGSTVKRVAIKDATGWSSTDGAVCDQESPGSNVYIVAPNGANFFLTVH